MLRLVGRDPRGALIVLLLLSIFLTAWRISSVSATGSGEVYISPSFVGVQPTGTSFTVQVNVTNMDPFNTYDIQVQADQRVINATAISVDRAGILNVTDTTPFEFIHCVNGSGQGCVAPGHSSSDGPGLVHSAFTLLGVGKTASGNGILFNITYQVVSTLVFYTPIAIVYHVVAVSGVAVAYTWADGRYGTAPDFRLSGSPPWKMQVGWTNETTVTVTSLNFFNGKVNLTTSSPAKGITVGLSTNQTLLKPNQSNTTDLTISVADNTTATSYTVVVNGMSGNLSRSVQVTFSVQQPDFEIGASPQDLRTHQASSNATTISVTSFFGFTGTVELNVTAPPGTKATFNQTHSTVVTLTVPRNLSVNATLSITTQPSSTPFVDRFNITATSGPLTRPVSAPLQVVAEPPDPDFNVTVTPVYASIQAGNSETVTIRVTSLDYYLGAIYVLGTTQSGLGFGFTHGNFTLFDFGQSSSATLTVTTATTTAVGNHTITLIVFGIGETSGATAQHSVELTLKVTTVTTPTVSQAKTLFGLQASQFYSIIIGLAVLLGVLGLFESRRSRRQFRSIILQD